MLVDLLRDQIWQFIGAVISALGIGISLWLFFLDHRKNKKELIFTLLANSPYAGLDQESKDYLNTIVGINDVHDLRVFKFKLENSGKQPIVKRDFEEPLMFCLSNKSKIVEFEVTSVHPRSLRLNLVKVDSSILKLKEQLLNSGDYFEGQIVATDCDGQIHVQARIVGISEVKIADRNKERIIDPTVAYGIISILASIISVMVMRYAFNFNYVLGWVFTINLLTYSLMTIDKLIVYKQGVRFAELLILAFSAVGGSFGTILATVVLNHKRFRRKPLFNMLIYLAAILQILILIYLRLTSI